MASYTEHLELLKKDPVADGAEDHIDSGYHAHHQGRHGHVPVVQAGDVDVSGEDVQEGTVWLSSTRRPRPRKMNMPPRVVMKGGMRT